MSSSANPQGGRRLRLPSFWSRGPRAATQRTSPQQRQPVGYAPAALPERQPAVATLIPTGIGRFAACAACIVLGLAAVLAAGLYEPALTAVELAVGPRFTRSIATVRACVDPRATLSLATWLAHLLLLSAAVVALAVRSMRWHRRDERRGRFRAWGWLSFLLVAASCATQVPVGSLVGSLVSEATGITLGPAGFGWWVATAGTLLFAVSLWAILPLYERMATALWLTAGLAAWAACTAAIWTGASGGVHPGLAPAAWTAGCGLITIAMLAAARSVIREARGEAGTRAQAGRSKPAVAEHAVVVAASPAANDDRSQSEAWSSENGAGTDYTDGSESDDQRETRHLSKAERKRLRKLARMSQAA